VIPLLAAREIRDTLLDYLRSTWQLADRTLEKSLLTFLAGDQGMFKGPWVRLALPFASAPPDALIPLDIRPSYPPYLHQLLAWQRLSSRAGHEPEATIVTTGTGSGKTECFLYPILDHAYRALARGEKGIKAIVLYPMNALAADQARRMAAVVHADDRLRGRLRVGMFVGGTGKNREMGPSHAIDDNDHLRRHPPDILLTNYRMLDLMLQRPRDAGLWAHNVPGRLRYLVLDELHTYDGAQGTDVACLVRRLGARLGGADAICPVGTSATVTGGGTDTTTELLTFASRIFDQRFHDDALVGESRLSAEELFALFGPGSETFLTGSTPSSVGSTDRRVASIPPRVALFFPSLASTDPRVASTATTIASTNPLLASTDPLLASTDPLLASTDPLLASTDPLLASTDPPLASTDPLLASTATTVASTDQRLPSTATTVASTDQLVASTDPSLASTDPLLASTATAVASTDRRVPSTATTVASTDPRVASTAARVASTDPLLASTATAVASADRRVPSTATTVASTEQRHVDGGALTRS
jgi:hypothetical protein